ncbi:MAG: hypothetical protein ACI8Y3_001413 [Paraglaciecola sp.]|jgi:hypothetical protein
MVSNSRGKEAVNQKLDSLARSLNIHVANGIEANGIETESIKLALFILSKANTNLLNEKLINIGSKLPIPTYIYCNCNEA